MAIPQRTAKASFLPPMATPVPDEIVSGYVRQHRKMTFSHQKKISVLSKRIMARVLEQIKYGETTLCPAYRVAVLDLIRDTNLDPSNVYKYAKAAVDELADIRWNFEDIENRVYIPRHLLNTSLPARDSSRVDDGIITIVLNPELAPYFVNLAGQYTTFGLDGYLELSSWYAMRLFEMLASWDDKPAWYVSIEEFRELMDCAPEVDKRGKPKKDKAGALVMKYPATKDLIEQTITRSQAELADTRYAFDFVAITAAKVGRGRPKITHLEFRVKKPRRTSIPPEWLENPQCLRLIEGLRKFEVSDSNIVEYWEIIKPAGLNRLLYEWMVKENSPDRINSKIKYCNAALVREGKKLLEYRRQTALQAKGQQELFPSSTVPAWLDSQD